MKLAYQSLFLVNWQLVKKTSQNYNESRLIAFNMTTLCITVPVYISSYMGTSVCYRTIISCFMLIFLGTLVRASIFAPNIYNSVPTAKNIPVTPSVTSITLNPNVDGRWGSPWAKFDSAQELNENVTITEKDDWPKKSKEFHYLSEKKLKENQETDTSTANKSQIVK